MRTWPDIGIIIIINVKSSTARCESEGVIYRVGGYMGGDRFRVIFFYDMNP